MKPNPKFEKLDKMFWANIRIISQHVGYTDRPPRRAHARGGKKQSGPIKVPTLVEIKSALDELKLASIHLIHPKTGRPTDFGRLLMTYYEYRAHVLNNFVKPMLMDKNRAKALFDDLRKKLHPKCPLPMNKQKSEKKRPRTSPGSSTC